MLLDIVSSLSNSQGALNNFYAEINSIWALIQANALWISIWLFIFSVLSLILLFKILREIYDD